MNGPASPNAGTSSTIIRTEGRTIVTNAPTAPNKDEKSNLTKIIEKSLEREIFVRIQKNLILLKVLADSSSKAGLTISTRSGKDAREQILNNKTITAFQQAIEQVKAAERRVSAIISSLVFQLYPDQVEAITLYMADVTMACAANQDIPMGLLNEIELPRVQKELSYDNEVLSSKKAIQDPRTSNNNEENGAFESYDQSAYFRSREYYLYLASIYLSETVEQMDKIFGKEVEKLTKLIRPEIASIENACSRIHKIWTKHTMKQNKWVWNSDFKTI